MNNSLSPYLCFQCQTFPEVAEDGGQLMNHNHQDKIPKVGNLQEAYKDKIELSSNLQEAYQQIETTLLIQQRKGNTDASFLLRRLP